jgi:hypothetical protein
MTSFELAPPTCPVIGDNCLKELQKGVLVDGFASTNLNRSCRQVPLPLVDHALWIGCERVVDENIEMVLRSQERADVAVKCKVGQFGAFDRFGHLWVGGMHEISHLTADLLLPGRERLNVVIDAGVNLVCTHALILPQITILLLAECACAGVGGQRGTISCSDLPELFLQVSRRFLPNLSAHPFQVAYDEVSCILCKRSLIPVKWWWVFVCEWKRA